MSIFSEVTQSFFAPYDGKKPEASRRTPSLDDLLLALSKAMDLLEGRPLRSAMRTAVMAGSIAKTLELSQREVTSIVYAALVHDIGLVKIVADIYPHLPPGVTEKQLFTLHPLFGARVTGTPQEKPLSPTLIDLLHQHPLMAAEFLDRLFLSEDVKSIVAAHHELIDGSGYPFGLSDSQIPTGAKILAFADTVEAVMGEVTGLTTRRHALDSFLDIKAPGKFDPDVIKAFQSLIDDHEDFLRSIFTLEVENMVRYLLPGRAVAMTGNQLLEACKAMGALADEMMPLYKRGRSENMAKMALQMASGLGIKYEQAGELLLAALLCDIGHLGTPISILMKNIPLTEEERQIMQDHALLTLEVLKGVPGFHNVSLWASETHERMNGQGYPGRKKSFEISVGGRILAITDVYDALTHPRPYRPMAYEPLDVIPVLGQGRHTLYDNQLVTMLRKVVLSMDIVLPV